MKTIFARLNELSDPAVNRVPDDLSPAYLPSLDGLRAISIMFVLTGHFLFNSQWYRYVSGVAGVNIFFAISGFLITTLLLKERAASGDILLKRFYVRRALRILPVAYLFLLVAMLLNRLFELHIDAMDFLTAFFYVKNLSVVHDSGWQTVHFWSLAVEEQFYLFFPLLLKLNFRWYVRVLILLLLTTPLANIIYYHGGGYLVGAPKVILGLIVCLFGKGADSILFGSLCAILVFKGMLPLRSLARLKFLAPVLVLVIALGFFDLAIPGWQVFWLYATPPACSALVLLSLQPGGWFFALLNARPMKWIGRLSYSIYIWQELFTHNQPWADSFPLGRSVWLNLSMLVVVACISYYGFEKKFNRLKDHFKAPSRQVPHAGPQGAFPGQIAPV